MILCLKICWAPFSFPVIIQENLFCADALLARLSLVSGENANVSLISYLIIIIVMFKISYHNKIIIWGVNTFMVQDL